jgi:hypothetical protein
MDARRRRLVDKAIVAAADVQHAAIVESQGGSVHHIGDERLHGEVQIDLVDRDRHLLAARPAEGGVDVAEGVHRRVGDRVQVLGNQHADIAGPRLAGLAGAADHQIARGSPIGNARDDEGIRADHQGRADFADGNEGPLRPGEALAANLQFAAGDGCRRGDLRDVGFIVRRFPQRHLI